MNDLIAFFEIPSADFERAVSFYNIVFKTDLYVVDCGTEKMAFFSNGEKCEGAVSYSPGFTPSPSGVLIHFHCEDIDSTLSIVTDNNGKTVIPKTKIEAEGKGYFATFTDSEGNNIGLYSDR